MSSNFSVCVSSLLDRQAPGLVQRDVARQVARGYGGAHVGAFDGALLGDEADGGNRELFLRDAAGRR